MLRMLEKWIDLVKRAKYGDADDMPDQGHRKTLSITASRRA